MSILSVDNISPIGSGTSVTINSVATLEVNKFNASGISTFNNIVDVTGSNSTYATVRLGSGANRRLMYRTGENDVLLEAASNFFYRQMISDTSHRWYTNGADAKVTITGAGDINIGGTTSTSTTDPLTVDLGGQYTANASITNANLKLKLYHNGANGDSSGITASASGLAFVSSHTTGHIFYTTPSINTCVEALRITGNNNLLIGSSNESQNIRLGNKLGIVGTAAYTGMSMTNYAGTNASIAPLLDFNRSRGTSDQSMTTVVTSDKLGEIIFRGSDGSNFLDAVTLRAYADSVSGSTINGRFEIGTTNGSHSAKLIISKEGHVTPYANNTQDLGSTAKGWRNVYMNDLNLSNMNGDTNDVDGTQGSWTIQEGKDDLYIINRLNGKKFKIKMEEIS
mgnify:CR=1 FL=1